MDNPNSSCVCFQNFWFEFSISLHIFQLTIKSCVCVARQGFRCGRSRNSGVAGQRFGNGLGVEGQKFRCGRSKAFGVQAKVWAWQVQG